jgi:hypothetical protein
MVDEWAADKTPLSDKTTLAGTGAEVAEPNRLGPETSDSTKSGRTRCSKSGGRYVLRMTANGSFNARPARVRRPLFNTKAVRPALSNVGSWPTTARYGRQKSTHSRLSPLECECPFNEQVRPSMQRVNALDDKIAMRGSSAGNIFCTRPHALHSTSRRHRRPSCDRRRRTCGSCRAQE